LSISPNILKEAALDNAMLYDGVVNIFKDSNNRLMAITNCFIYELQYAFVSHSGSLNISFFIELNYDYQSGMGPVQKGSRKLSVSRSSDLGIPIGEAGLPARYHFLPVVSSPLYEYTLSDDGKSLFLKIFADIRAYFTEHFFTSLHRCKQRSPSEMDGIPDESSEEGREKQTSQDQLVKKPSNEQSAKKPPEDQTEIEPPKDPNGLLLDQGTTGLKPVSWPSLLESISSEDALTILEHFIRLIKVSGREGLLETDKPEEPLSQGKVKCSGEEAYAPKPDGHVLELIDSQNAKIRQLEEELSSRSELIDKLLRLNHYL
jgi:hypothetical protein